jgi:hypothetical protein
MLKTNVRIAKTDDAADIKRLLAASDQDLPVPFENIEGFWLVAEREGKVVGCLQICYGRPIGCLEMMALDKDLSVMASGHARWDLALTGMAMLHRSGASYVRCFIPFRDKAHKNALRKRGAKVADNGNMMLRRLR